MNKIGLITGATSGIGLSTAHILAENGWNLVLTGRREERLIKIQSEIKNRYSIEVKILCFDVRKNDEVENAINSLENDWKNIDLLVNNAGLALDLAPINENSTEDWETMIDTNVKGLLFMSRAVSKLMIKRQKGQIINVGSSAGKEVYPNGVVYCSTKHAVEALTRGMRMDLFKHNIKVGSVSPGHVETEFAIVRFHGDEEQAKIYEDFTPLRPEDVADAIYYMASRPAHVNVQDIFLLANDQASGTIINRK